MWILWLGPLTVAIFLGVAVLSAGAFAVSKPKNGRRFAAALMAPVGCAAIPIAAIALLGVIGKATQKSDSQLYEEMFGYRTALTDDRMLFDDFGGAADREIFMRIEPDAETLRDLRAINGLTPSSMTKHMFYAAGARHDFVWWIENDGEQQAFGERCDDLKIYQADGFNHWGQFRIAECTGGGLVSPTESMRVFVVATRLPTSN